MGASARDTRTLSQWDDRGRGRDETEEQRSGYPEPSSEGATGMRRVVSGRGTPVQSNNPQTTLASNRPPLQHATNSSHSPGSSTHTQT
jgi:hypothetical protein